VIGVFAVAGAALSGLFSSKAPPSPPSAEGVPASAQMALPPAGAPDELRVVVRKSKRQLLVFRGDTQIRSFRVVLGSEPEGDKQREGDGRTPVGTFYVCEKNAESKFYLFMGISYPNEEDAARGLKDGLITSDQHDAILQAIAQRRTPPWYTRLGGEMGIHGGGTAWDWTRGCVALDNGDMRDLYALIREGTTVIIEP
jgi:murein L,D-transpeptidase YafK